MVGPTPGFATGTTPEAGPLSSVPAALMVPLSLCVSCVSLDVVSVRSTLLGDIMASLG